MLSRKTTSLEVCMRAGARTENAMLKICVNLAVLGSGWEPSFEPAAIVNVPSQKIVQRFM